MYKLFLCGTITFFLLSITGAAKEKCKDKNLMDQCPMALPMLSSPDISFASTSDELDKSCLELQAGIKCIENYTDYCMEPRERVMFKRIYSGITGVVHELCTDGDYQKEYLRHADCVKNVRPDYYDTCSRNYEVTLTSLSGHQQQKDSYTTDDKEGSQEDLRIVCCSFQEYLLCSEKTVQRACGDEAAQFTSKFLKRMASNIIKNFCLEYRGQECGLPNASCTSEPTFFLLAIAVLTHCISYIGPACTVLSFSIKSLLKL